MHLTLIPGLASTLRRLLACAALAPLLAQAGSFGVSPIRIDLDAAGKTGSVTITNDDPSTKLDMRVKLAEWTQDADGKDVYVDSNDLVYFPRILTLEANEQRVVRVGLKVPATTKERAYRLFLEELPKPRDPQDKGAHVAFVMRFGVPIFLPPTQGKPAASVDRLDAASGNILVYVSNTGNRHFRIDTFKLRSDTGFEKSITGGYVLAGVSKKLAIEVPRETCRNIRKLTVSMSTAQAGVVERAFDWDGGRCGR